MSKKEIKIKVDNLTIAYGDFVLMKNVSFEVNKGDIFIIMGSSGGGKSSLLRALTGLVPPAKGDIWIDGIDFAKARPPNALCGCPSDRCCRTSRTRDANP